MMSLIPSFVEVKLFNQPLQEKLNIIDINSGLYSFPYKTSGAMAFDLFAVIEEPIEIGPLTSNQIVRIPSWIAIQACNEDVEFGICLAIRSSLSNKFSLTNAFGIVDCDFQGQILCSISNKTMEYEIIEPGQRIAQAFFLPKIQVNSGFVVNEFTRITQRNSEGFGTTGKF